MGEKFREKPIPESKKATVKSLADKMKNANTILIASTKGLPASQFQAIKTKLRGTAEIAVAKKSIILRAIAETKKGSLQNLKDVLGSDFALMFSNMDAFELGGLLMDSQSPTKAKVGDIAPEDLKIDEGPTSLIPGPAISELGAVGLKVAVEGGKLSIRQGAVICKKGEPINAKVANVLGKLNIMPMKVGFIPVAAYDAKNDKIYTEIKIDKKGTLEALRVSISKAMGFAVNVGYFTKETVKYFIAKAGVEEKALETVLNKSKPTEEAK
jgi:large subunit ribosomal protein L10